MMINTTKSHQSNQNCKNTTNNGTTRHQMNFYNNNRIPQNYTQDTSSTFKRHLTNHSTLGDDARYANNKRQRQNSQGNAEDTHNIGECTEGWNDQNTHYDDATLNFNQTDDQCNPTPISK